MFQTEFSIESKVKKLLSLFFLFASNNSISSFLSYQTCVIIKQAHNSRFSLVWVLLWSDVLNRYGIIARESKKKKEIGFLCGLSVGCVQLSARTDWVQRPQGVTHSWSFTGQHDSRTHMVTCVSEISITISLLSVVRSTNRIMDINNETIFKFPAHFHAWNLAVYASWGSTSTPLRLT